MPDKNYGVSTSSQTSTHTSPFTITGRRLAASLLVLALVGVCFGVLGFTLGIELHSFFR